MSKVSKRAPSPRSGGKDRLGRPLWLASSVFDQKVCEFSSALDTDGTGPKRKRIALSELRPTQPKLEAGKVNSMMLDDTRDPIHVVEGTRGPRVLDGHHRAAAAILRGDDDIECHVWQPSESAVSKSERPTRPVVIEKAAPRKPFDESKVRRDGGKFASKGERALAGGSEAWMNTRVANQGSKPADKAAEAARANLANTDKEVDAMNAEMEQMKKELAARRKRALKEKKGKQA